ncbi:MAG: LysM peptidoglycan-binding domain-containing protein [Verrucomicrobiales bacterium]|nr:LysM peptidoglycan-binding domain-containing protein [Verrucomicrobiales bacterium]
MPAQRRPRGAGRRTSLHRASRPDRLCLSRRYGFTVGDLAAANPGVDPTRLRAGQTIRLPVR